MSNSNLEAIRAKLKGLEEGKPKSKRWKPTDEHTVRALPLPGEEDISFVVKWHYGVNGGRQMACPSTWGDDCAFCDLARKLKSWKDEKGRDKPEHVRKMDWEFFKKIDAAIKHYIPVAIRKKGSDELEGPFLWELTPKTYQAVLKICVNDDRNADHPDGGGYRVLTSLMHGVDLIVTLKKKGEKGNTTSFDLTEVEPRLKATPLVKGDLAAAQAVVAKIPTQGEIAKPVSTEEAQRVFDSWKGSMGDTPTSNEAGVEYSSHSAERPAQGGADVDSVVAKLEKLSAASK